MSEIVRSNIMQRLYDALPPHDSEPSAMLTVENLCARLHHDQKTIRTALRRLRRIRCIRSQCFEGEWLYGQRIGSVRPADSRGRKRR